jgi:HPr kinase/phosphorylase
LNIFIAAPLPLAPKIRHKRDTMRLHASCACYGNAAVLLLGPSGAGKSDLLLRLVDQGFELVADDQVEIDEGLARPPVALAGMMEVRGLGVFRLPYRAPVPLRLVVRLGEQADRLPYPAFCETLALPLIKLEAAKASAPSRVRLALDAVCGRRANLIGAFAA